MKKMFIKSVNLVFLLCLYYSINGYASGSSKTFSGPGNFSETSRWSPSFPVVGDKLIIINTCTLDIETNIKYSDLILGAAGNSGTIIWSDSYTLNIDKLKSVNINSTLDMNNEGILIIRATWQPLVGDVFFNPGTGTVHFTTEQGDVSLPDFTAWNNIIIDGVNIVTMTTDISLADLTIISTLNSDNYNININGNWNNSGTFIAGTGTVTLDGLGDQTIANTSGEIFYELIVNKPSGTLNLINDVIVSNTYTMTAGDVNAGSSILTLGTDVTNVGTLNHTSGTIVGKFEKWINAPGIYLFPVGTSTYYRPSWVTFNSLTSNGSLVVQFVTSYPGKNGLPLDDSGVEQFNIFTEGYWDFAGANSFASTDYHLELRGEGFTSYTIDADTRILKRANSGSDWFGNPPSSSGIPGSNAPPIVKRTGLSGVTAQFAFSDDTPCTPPVTSSITGSIDDICTNDVFDYSVTDNPLNEYIWTITGGTQTGGGNTSSITVTWGSTGQVGNVRVVEQSLTPPVCPGEPVDLAVNIHTLPTSPITGKDNVAGGATESYSVTERQEYVYAWTIVNGMQTVGGFTNSITVVWGSSGTGEVRVEATKIGCSPAVEEVLPVTIYSSIESIATGPWDDERTWDSGVVPQEGDNAIIKNGHTVTLPSTGPTITINNFSIEAGGELNGGNKKMIVNGGDFNVDGVYTGSSDLELQGSGTIDGTGTISNTGILEINGNRTILSTADLTRSVGDILIKTGITVTNNGIMTLQNDLIEENSSSIFENAANGTLNIGGALFAVNGQLRASATGNTVNYNGMIAQDIKDASSSTYFNLSTNGSGTKSLTAGVDIKGNLEIGGTSQLDVTVNNWNINLAGDWITSGSFIAQDGTVIFDGSTVISGLATTSLNNVTISGTLTGVLSGNFNIAGNWNNSGTFTHNDGTVTFNGLQSQTMQGTEITAFNNLTIDNSIDVDIISGNYEVINTLTLNAGTFKTNDQLLTLVSNSTSTARIAQVPPGVNITGNVIVQRFISSRPADWGMLSTPVSNSNLSDWDARPDGSNEIYMSGVGGINGDACCPIFVSVETYDESTNNYVTKTVSSALVPGEGVSIFLGDNLNTLFNLTMDTRGTPNFDDQAFTVTNTPFPGGEGWNLMGNPFASHVSWSDILANSPTLDPILYIFNADEGNYKTFGPGFEIPPYQGFFIYTSSTSTMSIPESAKTTATSSTFWKTSNSDMNSMKLKITSDINSYFHETIIKFDANALENYASYEDARFLKSFIKEAPSLTTFSKDNIELVRNGLPDYDDHVTVPLVAKTGIIGNYEISVIDMEMPSSYRCVLLEDLQTGRIIDLSNTDTYSFYISDKTKPSRFLLHFSKSNTDCNTLTSIENPVVAEMAHNINIIYTNNGLFVEFNFSELTNVKISMKNLLGQKVKNDIVGPITNNKIKLLESSHSQGLYILKVEFDNQLISRKIVY
ncbi:MAG: T9SS type A sorting domain-containing protein [Bacteroidota bacterium]